MDQIMSKRVCIIAEAGVNHNGSLDRALELVDVAADAGADIVKFQTFKAEASLSRFAHKCAYQIKNTGNNESQLEMVKKLELDENAHRRILEHCKTRSILFMATPFDHQSVDFLVKELKVSQLKIASGEITNAPLLLKAAQSNLPILLSTGMSSLGDIEMALGVLAFGYLNPTKQPSIISFIEAFFSSAGQNVLKEKISLLHCTTEYPAPYNEVNLSAMKTMKQAFGLPVGFSDHTKGISIPIAAVGMGATIIEKHFTLDKNLPGPDHIASLEPQELNEMVKAIREVELAIGNSRKIPASSEMKNLVTVRKSLVASTEIKKGDFFTLENLTVKRPGNGITPIHMWEMLGKKANKDYSLDEVILESI
jgi:N-acetylneuraminate synthase